ncbi:unnamed protein product [Rhizoctonia solani]|uniref:Nephrocystin 3-like N-terminal domain-containing protein n=1 Tax=Rhizoctonia solani TaxID=456999 RepID=A0A8H3CJI9_9AGAM|nr:unnamed protein product [Rhizoctonia solani]
MLNDPPVLNTEFRYYITEIEFQPSIADSSCKISMKLLVDDNLVCSLPWLDNTQPFRWTRLIPWFAIPQMYFHKLLVNSHYSSLSKVSPRSKILLRPSKLFNGNCSFNFPSYQVSEVDDGTGEMALEHPEIVWNAKLKFLTPPLVEQLFPVESDKFSRIEDNRNNIAPGDPAKHLFQIALHFASVATKYILEHSSKLTFLILVKTWEVLEQHIHLDDAVQGILHGLVLLRDVVEVLKQASSSKMAIDMSGLKASVHDILVLLEDMSVYIFNRLSANNPADTPDEDTNPSDTYDVETFLDKLGNLQRSFHLSWPLISEPPPFMWEHATTVDQHPTTTTAPCEILILLRPTHPSGYDPDRACMDGTRQAILNRIVTWTQNSGSSESFMWISGQAGMGKSSIATSLCQRLDKIGALAGSFFCRRDDPRFNDPLLLVDNLVYEIAMQCPPYAHEVGNTIRSNRRLCTAHLSLRFEGLVKRPFERLKSLAVPIRLVVVIDGLDECGDYNSRERILHELYDMSKLVPWLKVIFTARPEGELVNYFQRHCSGQPIVHLQEYNASEDIHAYTQAQLGELAQTERWPDEGISRLCEMAEGVFLWAGLAIQYLKQSTIPTLPRLRKVLENRQSPVTGHLDALYTRALKVAMRDSEVETIEAYGRCIGAILATSERGPLKIPDLQYLILAAGGIEPRTLEQIITNLGPLVLVTDNQYVRFHHSSVKDYVDDPSRSRDCPVQLQHYEADLASCSLKLMQRDLRFNICSLETSYIPNSEVPDLQLRVHSHIGPALSYACIHWIDHFISSPNQVLVETIRAFFERPNFLYWIEVLSLLGRVDIAIKGLSKLVSLGLTQFADWTLIVFWAKDAHRFLLSFYDAISASAPHLYVSALAFAPSTSVIAQKMRPYFPNTIKFAKGGNSAWHPCIRLISHPHPIQSLSVSSDGLGLATGYLDGSICIWDFQTGAPIRKPLIGHSSSVTCVTFSPNGKFIASSSYDTTIRVWSLSGSAEMSHLLPGHTGPVHAVAFSPNATLIASGSSDTTIRLWSTNAMEPVSETYTGHSSRVSALAFSPDGAKLVSGSWDRTIRIWSVELDGLQLGATPLLITGRSDSITCVAFSPDGSKIASGSVDKTVRMWDAQTGSEIEPRTLPPKHSNSVTSVAFSSNGKLLASSSSDGATQLWDSITLAPFSQPFGHSNRVNGVAFSFDGAYVVTGSTDMTTRVWGTGACPKPIATDPFIGHSDSVYSVAISSDGTRITSASRDKTVRIWDAQNGSQIGDPFAEHSEGVAYVSFSPDGAQIVSGSGDKFMKFWDATTHACIHSYEHNSKIRCIAFSVDGAVVALGSEDHKIYLWDAVRRTMLGDALQGHSNYILSIAFSPDGTYFASSSADHSIMLWDIRTHNRLRRPLSGHTNWVRSVTFSPCGTKLVSGSSDKTVRVWDAESGNPIQTLNGHSDEVTTAVFSLDGSYIASGSYDRTVRLWNVTTGCSIGEPLTGHSHRVWSLVFSPDGSYLVSCSTDGTLRVWAPDVSHAAADLPNDPTSTFCWPTNPHELSSHPQRPGWVTHDQRSLDFWFPIQYQQPDLFLSLRTRVPTSQTFLDYSNFKRGTTWTQVACDPVKHGAQ